MKATKIAFLTLALAGAVTPAAAQDTNEIRLSGQTLGCFGENCAPTVFSQYGLLSFTGYAFDEYTRGGRMSLIFGHFDWDAFLGETLVDSPFTLFLAFTNPTGIQPDPEYGLGLNGMVVRGKVNGVRTGSSDVLVNFTPNQQEYTFTGGQPDVPGKFTLTLYDAVLDPNAKTQVLGKVTDATVTPEPISMVLMGSGLAGIAAARRRRKRQQDV